MRRAGFIISVLGFVAAVAHAPLSAGQAPRNSGNPTKFETIRFESALRAAVVQAGQKLAEQARVLVPEVTLDSSEPPIVRGVKLPDYGYVFDVQAPNIQSSILLFGMLQQTLPARGPAPSTMPVARPSATAIPVTPDAMSVAPAAFDPTRAYTDYVKEGLIETMIVFSEFLPISATDRLVVVVNGVDEPNSPLARALESKGIISIKGSDLLDLRQGKITREQAKERIVEERF